MKFDRIFSALAITASLLFFALSAMSQPSAVTSPAFHVQAGYVKYDNKDYTGAVGSFSECLRLDPNKVDCYSARGDAYRRLEKYPEAIADYNQSLKLVPNQAMVYAVRAVVYTSKVRAEQKTTGYNRKAFDPAIADYDMALKLDPANVKVKAASDALRSFLDESDKLAVLQSQKAALEADVAARAQRIKGTSGAMLMLGQFDSAILGYSSCIRALPKDVECLVGRAKAYVEKSKSETPTAPADGVNVMNKTRLLAMDDVNKALQLDPRSAAALTVRGRIYALEGLKDKAIADLRSAVRLDPNHAEAKSELGKLGVTQ